MSTLAAIIAIHPALTLYGFGLKVAGVDCELPPAAERIEKCSRWLRERIEPTKLISTHLPDSYGLKHRYSKATGVYIENGAFIAAAALAGFNVRPCPPNAAFNMRARSWAEFDPRRGMRR